FNASGLGVERRVERFFGFRGLAKRHETLGAKRRYVRRLLTGGIAGVEGPQRILVSGLFELTFGEMFARVLSELRTEVALQRLLERGNRVAESLKVLVDVAQEAQGTAVVLIEPDHLEQMRHGLGERALVVIDGR